MLPLLLAGAIWGYNVVRIAQLADRNKRIKKREQDEKREKNLTIFHDCTFKQEDRRRYYSNCTFNYYIIRKGEEDERR